MASQVPQTPPRERQAPVIAPKGPPPKRPVASSRIRDPVFSTPNANVIDPRGTGNTQYPPPPTEQNKVLEPYDEAAPLLMDDGYTEHRVIGVDGRERRRKIPDDMPEPPDFFRRQFWNRKFPLRQRNPIWVPLVFSYGVPVLIDELGETRTAFWFAAALRIAALVFILAVFLRFSYWLLRPYTTTKQKIQSIRIMYMFQLFSAIAVAFGGIATSIALLDPSAYTSINETSPFWVMYMMNYFAWTTQVSVGYGDISPQTRVSRGVIVIHEIVTIFFIGIIGAIALAELRTPPIVDRGKRLPTDPSDLYNGNSSSSSDDEGRMPYGPHANYRRNKRRREQRQRIYSSAQEMRERTSRVEGTTLAGLRRKK